MAICDDLQVLGMPAHYTVNPRTGAIDYIQVYPELLSIAAFKEGVRSTCAKTQGGDIQIVIPAYLTQDHFQRALPLLPGILRVKPWARGSKSATLGPASAYFLPLYEGVVGFRKRTWFIGVS